MEFLSSRWTLTDTPPHRNLMALNGEISWPQSFKLFKLCLWLDSRESPLPSQRAGQRIGDPSYHLCLTGKASLGNFHEGLRDGRSTSFQHSLAAGASPSEAQTYHTCGNHPIRSRRLCFRNSDSFGSRQLLAFCNEYMEMKRFRQQDFL